MQTGKDHLFTTERLVKIVLIAHVSSNIYGVRDILEVSHLEYSVCL